MSDRMEYQVALQKDGRSDTYDSAALFANSDDDAVQMAKLWTHSFDGKGIASLRPGQPAYPTNRA